VVAHSGFPQHCNTRSLQRHVHLKVSQLFQKSTANDHRSSTRNRVLDSKGPPTDRKCFNMVNARAGWRAFAIRSWKHSRLADRWTGEGSKDRQPSALADTCATCQKLRWHRVEIRPRSQGVASYAQTRSKSPAEYTSVTFRGPTTRKQLLFTDRGRQAVVSAHRSFVSCNAIDKALHGNSKNEWCRESRSAHEERGHCCVGWSSVSQAN
jgi:hypothetical protein